jgi:hypothetical protein
MAATKSPRTVLVLGFVIGIGLLLWFWDRWPWSTIGVALAFGGVLVMLLRASIKDYGDTFTNEDEANRGFKPSARWMHKYIFAVGVPLVVLGALFQMLGNPGDKNILHGENIPDKIVYLPLNAEKKSLDLEKLDKALGILQANQKATQSTADSLGHVDLLVVNCSAAPECQKWPHSFRQLLGCL